MFRLAATVIAKRFPRIIAQPATRSSSARFNAGHTPTQQQSHEGVARDSLYALSITTYSPWDPCATRTLLQSGGPISARHITPRIEDILANYAPPTIAQKRTPATTAVKEPDTKAVAVTSKPWPYRLPVTLQPKAGTTYHTQYRGKTATTTTASTERFEHPVRVSFLQALLYGMQDPDSWKVKKEKGIVEIDTVEKKVKEEPKVKVEKQERGNGLDAIAK